MAADPNEAAATAVADQIREFDGTAGANSFDITYTDLIDAVVSDHGALHGSSTPRPVHVRDQPLELSAGGCERNACERYSPAPSPERPGDNHA